MEEAMDFDLGDPFPDLPVSDLFAAETGHMPCREKLNHHLHLRHRAVSILRQVQTTGQPSWDSPPLVASGTDGFVHYLATNYLDRFLSATDMPESIATALQGGKQWVVELLAVACLSLASKMWETSHFSFCHLLEKVEVACEAETIQRMELLVLGALQWRMRSVTPFSFLGFFLGLFHLKDPRLLSSLRARATQVILKSQPDTRLLDYNPSTIAASAAITAAKELLPLQLQHSYRRSILSCSYIIEEELSNCCKVVEEAIEIVNQRRRYHSSSSESEITGERKRRRICGVLLADYDEEIGRMHA